MPLAAVADDHEIRGGPRPCVRHAIASTPPGSEVTLTLKRGGNERQLRATLGEFTPEAERPRDQE
jgi:hypothetical protein